MTKIEYGIINNGKETSLVADVEMGSELTENKDLENFTRDEFNGFADNMIENISNSIGGIANGAEVFVKFPHGLKSVTPVRNYDEAHEAFKTDFELYKDVVSGKMKGFGKWKPVKKSKKSRR